jgi:hypothetical protein
VHQALRLANAVLADDLRPLVLNRILAARGMDVGKAAIDLNACPVTPM